MDFRGVQELPPAPEPVVVATAVVALRPIPHCSVCRKPQRMTGGGATCPEGHGGAPSVDQNGEGMMDHEVEAAIGSFRDFMPGARSASPPPLKEEEDMSDMDISDSVDGTDGKPGSVRPVGPDEKVLRWTFTAKPSEYTQRKLQAVCILAEGDMPLRVVSPKGNIIVPEEDGLRVNPESFLFLSGLFGLG